MWKIRRTSKLFIKDAHPDGFSNTLPSDPSLLVFHFFPQLTLNHDCRFYATCRLGIIVHGHHSEGEMARLLLNTTNKWLFPANILTYMGKKPPFNQAAKSPYEADDKNIGLLWNCLFEGEDYRGLAWLSRAIR